MGQITVRDIKGLDSPHKIRISLGLSYLWVMCLGVMLFWGISGGVAGADTLEGQPVKISLESRDNRNPVLSFKTDGENGFVSWDGLVNGKRRILFREMQDSVWKNPLIIDTDPAGNHQYPSITSDSANNVYVAWIGTVNGRKTPHLAMRINNIWTVTIIPFPVDSTVKGNCDYVNVKLDTEEKPWITWQWGFGNIYSVAVSYFQENGSLDTIELTHKSKNHNLFPKVFFLPEPTVVWYRSVNSNFEIASKILRENGIWSDTILTELRLLPANSLPNLFMGEQGINAIWYDNGLQNQDQIQYTVAGEIPEMVNNVNHSGGGNRFVSGSSFGKNLGFAWTSQDTRAVMFSYPKAETIRQVSGSESNDPSAPQIDSNSKGSAVVWMSDGSATANNSRIYFNFIPY